MLLQTFNRRLGRCSLDSVPKTSNNSLKGLWVAQRFSAAMIPPFDQGFSP
jgi:hypothetical protein